jgi:SAM-dependent methyltransferase
MDKKYDKNPNTVESLNWLYSKRWSPASERENDWMYPYIDKLLKENNFEKILEVGCGFGKTLSYIQKKIQNKAILKGTDINKIAMEKGAEYYDGIIFEQANYETVKENEVWDFIICSQTLEHVDNPVLMINNMKSALKEKGTLLITVPWPKSNLDNGVKAHYWRFYDSDFKKLLPGCKVEKSTTRMVVIWTK